MTSVFIGGSRNIAKLPSAVMARLDNLIAKDLLVLIGDADGIDKLVQAYLASKGYGNAIVFCTGKVCRNNVGQWEVQPVIARNGEKGFAYYAVKDQQMANEASYGFMIWDAKSNGTLNNMLNLLARKKQSLVWFTPENTFYTIRNVQDLTDLLKKCRAKDSAKFEAKLNLSERINNMQPELAFA